MAVVLRHRSGFEADSRGNLAILFSRGQGKVRSEELKGFGQSSGV